MFERPQTGNRAVLVSLALGSEAAGAWAAQQAEFADLARSAGAEIAGHITGARSRPDPRFFVGSGKADEIALAVSQWQADVVIFNHALSPSQERNLERHLQCRVLDRSGLILDIFAQRARSHEGKLQVELAQLRHMSTRLVRGWTHLERQKGGIGLRGPGETQLETDRRLLAGRIQHIERRLDKVRRSREQGRQARRRHEIPTVALVGYTNAGKSTLFNALTQSDVYAADQLFATLDPTLRRVDLAPQRSVILADTVGFVRDLPHELVAAFKATLTETREAALLLHVIDAADPEREAHVEQVEAVLREIGADSVPIWKIYNKIDCLPVDHRVWDVQALPSLDELDAGPVEVELEAGLESEAEAARVLWVSAVSGEGLEALADALARHFTQTMFAGWIALPAQAGRLRSQLYDQKAVQDEQVAEGGGFQLKIHVPERTLHALLREADLPQDPEQLRCQLSDMV